MLVCCESSGVVREAFRAKGVDAWSCDLLPADDGSPHHIRGDCLLVMQDPKWRAFGMHPPCTYLTSAGIHWNNRGRGWHHTNEAVSFVYRMHVLSAGRPYYLENPVGVLSTKWRKPDQIIQPYEFGEDASKKTCLWLQGLPRLVPTRRVRGRLVSGRERWANQTDSGQNKLPPSADRWKIRSKTYQGIADAMAEQWAGVVTR